MPNNEKSHRSLSDGFCDPGDERLFSGDRDIRTKRSGMIAAVEEQHVPSRVERPF